MPQVLGAILPALATAGGAVGGALSSAGTGIGSALGMGAEAAPSVMPEVSSGILGTPGFQPALSGIAGTPGMMPGAAAATGGPAGGGGILDAASGVADQINPIMQLLSQIGGMSGGGAPAPSMMPARPPPEGLPGPSVYQMSPIPTTPGPDLMSILRAMQLQG